MAALAYYAVAAVDRILGGDPLESGTAPVCPACDGAGRIENDVESLSAPMWVDCQRCDGLGVFLEPDVFEESRPVDLDDCASCDGQGLIEVNDWMTGAGMVDVTCTRCGGTGERGAA